MAVEIGEGHRVERGVVRPIPSMVNRDRSTHYNWPSLRGA
jgi:hypothetical protein